MKPTFVGIGAQKCASTWLYDVLSDHPEVAVSQVKEVDFFSRHYDFGYQWYERFFASEAENPRAVGEVSPSYFHEPAVPERIFRYDPGIRLLVVLRDPVERAISNHQHDVRVGHFQGDDLSFECGLANNPSYIEQGLYATHLQRWLDRFPREQLLVILFDEIREHPRATVQTVYEYLGIARDHESKFLRQASNVAYVNRYPRVERAKNSVRAMAGNLGVAKLWNLASQAGLHSVYGRFNRVSPSFAIPEVSVELRAQLRSQFSDEVERLEHLLDRPLESWK